MNSKNCLNVIVIFVNLLVLYVFISLYYTIENLKTVLSNENVPKESSKTDEGYTNNFDDFKITNQNVNIRHTRSTNPVKCNFVHFYTFKL